MIQRFIAAVHRAGIHIDYRDAQDILWLSRLLPKPAPKSAPVTPSSTSPALEPVRQPTEAPVPRQAVAAAEAELLTSRSTGPSVSTGVYVPSRGHAGEGTRRASAVRLPAVSALPGALGIARSLRPLMRKRSSPRRLEFDADATVDRYGDTGVLVAMLRQDRERWFDVAFVVDDGPSMAVWKRTAAEFHRLLERQGAFSDVRQWRLLWTASEVRIVSRSGLVRHWRELHDPSGRRLVILFSDFVSSYWREPEIWRLLADLGRTTSVALLDVLPERLWPTTVIGEGSTAVRNRVPGAPNVTWEVERSWWDQIQREQLREEQAADDGEAERLAPTRVKREVQLPVLTLVQESIGTWARLVMGSGGAAAPAIGARAPFPRDETLVGNGAMAAHARVEQFKAFASPTAYQLAVYLSAVPLSLPVMRLVQRAMLPASRQVHLAEFFVGGLIERITDADADATEDEVGYDFYLDVRALLQESLTRPDVLRVMQAVSRYLERNFGQPLDFRALVPDSGGEYRLPEFARPFATIGAQLLERIGHTSAAFIADGDDDKAQATCFVVMGFGRKVDFSTGRTLDLNKTYQTIIKPAASEAGLACIRADEIAHQGAIDVPMYEQLLTAEVVVADLSTSDRNALYELGVRHALRPYSTIVICEDGVKTFPFDANHVLIQQYHHMGEGIDYGEVERFRRALRDSIATAFTHVPRVVDSPVYRAITNLRPATLRETGADVAATIQRPTVDDDEAGNRAPGSAEKAAVSKGTCFVVMGFGKKTDLATGRTLDLDQTYRHIIKPAVIAAGLTCIRADEILHSAAIDAPTYEQLLTADFVIADLSTSNANAYYQLGLRHGLRPHSTIVICEDGVKSFPFDVNHVLIRQYHHSGDNIDFGEVERFRTGLSDAIVALLDQDPRRPDSPVYTFLNRLAPPSLESPAVEFAGAGAFRNAGTPADTRYRELRAAVDEARKAGADTRYPEVMAEVDKAQKAGDFATAETLLTVLRRLMNA